jgi:myosin-9
VSDFFDDNIILRQLRYTGMLETVRIRRAGYSIRIQYQAFIDQYKILLAKGAESSREDVEQFFISHPLIETANVQFGKTKIYMRDAEKLLLDDHLHRAIMQHICTLQRWFRTLQARRRFLKLRKGVIRMQAWVRGMCARNELRRQSLAAIFIQTAWRRYRSEQKYKRLRRIALTIQSLYRGKKAREQFDQLRAHEPTLLILNNLNNNEVAKKKLAFDINRVHTISLNQFDLNDPESLAQFASKDVVISDTEEEFTEEQLSSAEDEDDIFDDTPGNIDLDATFILENTRLKLIAR